MLDKLNRVNGLGVAAAIISASYLLSRILGLVRDRMLASHFGIGALADSYTAAFRLPDLLFTLLVSGAFSVAFIPVFLNNYQKDRRHAWETASSVLTILGLATIALAAIAYVAADPITKLISPGFDAYRHHLTVGLTRIMLITPFLFAVSSVLGAVEQSFSRFIFFAFSSVLYNLGIIFGIIFLSPHLSIYGVAWGVVIGATAQALLQLFGGIGLGFKFGFRLLTHDSLKVFLLMLPRSLDLAIDQINWIIETIIGSNLATGSITAYYYANNLKNVPLGIFGTAIATAAFPSLIKHASSHDKTKLTRDIVSNLRLILFLIMPSAVIAVLMRGYIVRLLFGFGNSATADALGWLVGSMVATSLFFLVSRVFYALGDTKTPLYTSLASIVINVALSLTLSRQFGVSGLAMGLSAASIFELVLLLYILHRRLGTIGGRQVWAGFAGIMLSSVVMGTSLYLLISLVLPLYANDRGFYVVGTKFIFLSLIGGILYMGVTYFLGLPEANLAINRLKNYLPLPVKEDKQSLNE